MAPDGVGEYEIAKITKGLLWEAKRLADDNVGTVLGCGYVEFAIVRDKNGIRVHYVEINYGDDYYEYD